MFTAGLTPLSGIVGTRANLLFAPVFEKAILEVWERKWGGVYTLGDAIVEIHVDYGKGGIELLRLETSEFDWLAIIGYYFGPRCDRKNIVSYLWPGNDERTWRYCAD